jgi:nucleoid-associated protein YgaU
MAGFPFITVRHPRPHDLVDIPVEICGVATGFEGEITARVSDGNGKKLVERTVRAGGMGIWGNFHKRLPIAATPQTPDGKLEIFEYSPKDGKEVHKRVVRIVFGPVLLPNYMGFAQHKVAAGETLKSISKQWYGKERHSGRILEANRNQLGEPPKVAVGQVLRIPQ